MTEAVEVPKPSESAVQAIAIDQIDAEHNVRHPVSTAKWKEGLKGLEDSIRAQGILQPLLVSTWNNGCHGHRPYRLVAGHRRYVAGAAIGLKMLPCVVRTMTEGEVREVQLVENLQREDLTEIEEGRAFQAYLEETKSTQASLAKQIGKSQPYIANRLRLLQLPHQVQVAIDAGELSASHGEVLLKIPKEAAGLQIELAKEAYHQKMPVGELEGELRWKLREWENEEALRKAKCPTCAGPATRYTGYNSDVMECVKGHTFDKNGKVVKQPSWGGYTRPAPKKRDETESPTLRSLHDVDAIARALVLAIKEPKWIRRLVVTEGYNGGGRIELNMDKLPPEVKGFAINAVAHAYSTGEKTEVHVEAYDTKRRRSMKDAYAAWEKKSLPKVAPPKKKGKPVDPKVLEGSVADVVRKLPRDLELLEELRELEKKGKKRNGVFDEIDLRIRSKHGGY